MRVTKTDQQLADWRVVTLEDPAGPQPRVRVGTFRLPPRFGGWWRHMNYDDNGDERPSGREIVIWMRARNGAVVTEEVTFRGFEDEFERQGVPALRDQLQAMFSLLDGREQPQSWSAVMKNAPLAVRDRAMRETRRRRRANAVPVDEVADLYRRGGHAEIMRTHDVSEATAYRWIKAARDAGVLEARS